MQNSNEDSLQQTACFKGRLVTSKITHNRKKIPQDFFPKTFSQSPKKRKIANAQQMQEWYQRQQSPQQNKGHFNRIQRKFHKIMTNQVKPIQEESSRKNIRLYNDTTPIKVKQDLIQLKLNGRERDRSSRVRPPLSEQKRMPSIIRNHLQKPQVKKQSLLVQSKRVRVIRSQNKNRKRYESPSNCKERPILRQIRFSMKEIPQRLLNRERSSGKVNVGFDGTLTFNGFRS